MGKLASSDDPDKMQYKAAFQHAVHCLLGLNSPQG